MASQFLVTLQDDEVTVEEVAAALETDGFAPVSVALIGETLTIGDSDDEESAD